MIATLKPHPWVKCPQCGHQTSNLYLAKRRCPCEFAGRRCEGTMQVYHHPADWAPCTVCNSTGEVHGVACVQCRGDGWLFMRGK